MSISSVQQEISRLEKDIGGLKSDHAKKINEANLILAKITKKDAELVKKQSEYKKLVNQ